MQALAVDRQHLRRRGYQGFQFVRQRPALFGICFLQLVDDQDFALKVVTPRGRDAIIINQAPVLQTWPTDGPDEGCPHCVLAAAFIATMQHGVVDLDARVLNLERHHVEQVLPLTLVGDQQRYMVKPRLGVAWRAMRPGITPPIAVNVTVTRYKNALACGVGNADQHLGFHRLPVLVKANGRLNTTPVVDRLTGNVPEQRVKCGSRNLAPVLQIEERLVLLDVGEPFVPVCLLDAAEFLALYLGDDLGSGIWKRRSRAEFG